MEFEFDKEIDFLLRQTAQGEAASAKQIPDAGFQIPASNHLDADEISSFAENALPEKTRQNYVRHLADCARCREGLSSLIRLNDDANGETEHVAEKISKGISASPIPWYRKFFAVPNLAYLMGALITVFAGIAVFTMFQSNDSPDSQVSQISEKQIGGGKGMSSDGDAAMLEIYGNQASANTMAMSNMSSNITASSSNSAMSAAPLSAGNSNAAATRRGESNLVLREGKSTDGLKKADEIKDSSIAAAPPSKPNENKPESDDSEDRQSPILSQNSGAQNQTQIMPDTKTVQSAPMPSTKLQSRAGKAEDFVYSRKAKSAEMIVIGGKNFNRTGNVWTDAEYRGQTTTNITLGTKDYKKLDAGLRGIVENLGGTVIVVWKEKAYRIQ